MSSIREELAGLLSNAFLSQGVECSPGDIEASFEIPREEKFGDLSTSLCLKFSKQQKKAPRPFAEAVLKSLNEKLSASASKDRLAKTTVEGPGFLNFYYSLHEVSRVLQEIQTKGKEFGRSHPAQKNRILLEYVSANPTGPLTVAHGRQAALGDSLARILRFCGHEVTTEYYNNDEGVQITTLGKSLYYRLAEVRREHQPSLPENPPIPEEYYKGDYLIDIARQLYAKNPLASLEECRLYARETIMQDIKKDLADFGVPFDSFYSQEALGKSGKVEKTLEELKTKRMVYESEGAVWLRSTDYGDDKDRVLIKSDKNYTYLTPDIAYHHEKFNRGFDRLIDILGPDHHGYIARLKASQAALGHDPNKVHVLIAQLVTLYEGDKQVRMSTRAGEFITLRQILDEVGRDAGRFFFVMRKFDAHLDFDLQLAKSQTPDNPAFYIQYAHARIESVKNLAREKMGALPDLSLKEAASREALKRLVHPLEVRLMQLLAAFEENVEGAAVTLEPYRLVPYLTDLAAAFHRFYTENRVVTEEADLTLARLVLIDCTQKVLRSGLELLGVSAPLKM